MHIRFPGVILNLLISTGTYLQFLIDSSPLCVHNNLG